MNQNLEVKQYLGSDIVMKNSAGFVEMYTILSSFNRQKVGFVYLLL